MYKMITLLCLVLCALLISCDPIEDNSRIGFELKVTDNASQPLSDIDANVFLRSTPTGPIFVIFPSFEGFEALLGLGSTDTQGEVSLVSLEPDIFLNEIAVVINGDEQFGESAVNQEYGTVIYYLDSIASRTTILPDVVLKRSAILEVEIIDIPDIEGTLNYTITYPTRIQQFRFPSDEEAVSEMIQGSGVPAPTGILTFDTLQNTTATFTYTITSSTGAVETNTIEIPINQETVQYAFEF